MGLGKIHILQIVLAAPFVVAAMAGTSARAATATYVEPAVIDDPTLAALSTSGDDAGYVVGLNQTLGILLDQPVGVTSGGSITVFTVQPPAGQSRATIRIGSYNNGNPIFTYSRRVNGGNSRTLNNLFQRGCGAFSGCDYIEIITTRTRRGANGVEVDYITVDGQIVEVTSPTPEPATWALMILGFCLVAGRLKMSRLKTGQALLTPLPQAASG